MKLNECVYDLLEIFDSEKTNRSTIYFRLAKFINTNSHVLIEQDKPIDYYGYCVLDLFARYHPEDSALHENIKYWQLREVYRIVNAALASYSDSLNPIRGKLKEIKVKLEATEYIAVLLHQIDSGTIPADVVCSGHGVWFKENGEINLGELNSNVVVYSGLGGALEESLGVDIENENYDPNSVVVKNEVMATVEKIEGFPRFFRNCGPHKIIPDFCLVETGKVPHPRVIEPMTGRVLFDMTNVPKSNYFSLSSVLKRFNGRTVHWAACTGVQYQGNRYPAPYNNYYWDKDSPPHSKRRKLSEFKYEEIPGQLELG